MPPQHTKASNGDADADDVDTKVTRREIIIKKYPSSTAARQKQEQVLRDEAMLRMLFSFLCFLSVMMVVWILYFPGSWLIGRSQFHDDLIMPALDGKVIPVEIVTKYEGHNLVQLTHILPGAIWAGAIPFQLNPSFRKRHPVAHRRIGYTFLSCSLLMAMGIFIILHRKLSFEHFFEDLPPKQLSSEPLLCVLAVMFLLIPLSKR